MKSLMTFTSPPEPCAYLPDQTWQFNYHVVKELSAAEYMDEMKAGWRRFGHAIFRPACPSCRMCQSLRVPVATFQPNRSQRRAWKANDGVVRLVIGRPSYSHEKRALRDRFQAFQHDAKGWPRESGDYVEMFVENPLPTEEWCYFVDNRLIAVGYVDAVPQGLSAIYFYYEPDERRRSPGTFNVLSVISEARKRGLPHAYLGYYVRGCPSLEYKARFVPNEALAPSGHWVPFVADR
jgi:leucyl-tRNA---protein transferase